MKFFIILLLPLIFSCGNNASPANVEATKKTLTTDSLPSDSLSANDLAGNFSGQTTLKFDSLDIKKFIDRFPLFKNYQSDLYRFYSPRQFAYAWHQQDGNTIEQSNILYNRVYNIDEQGLPKDIPYPDAYTNLMEYPGTDSMMYRELMITSQYLVYARKVVTGISEAETKSINWYVPRKKIEFTSLLDSILKGNTAILNTVLYPQYYLLRDKLKLYNEIQKRGSWIVLKADQKKYQLGDSSSTILHIRKKLYLAGDISADSESPIYDSVIYNGISEFQRRYGLKQDGVAGPGVIKEMSAPLSQRMEQIIVNMERSRWVENETSKKYLVVNIPQFSLLAYTGKTIAWTMPVVVGKTTNKTAIFKGDLKFIVFSPYWNIPQSIINKEVTPGMRRNKNYLANHQMEWNGGKVRQKPGPKNSLGLVKFLFPNSFDIYLHDTPSKSLFNEDKRAFSHGCIRVSGPKKLAEWLLTDSPQWTSDKIDMAMNSGKEQYVTLKETVPVYIVYFTAFVDDKGKLNFRDDIYQRDNQLKDMIFTKNAKKSAQ